MTKSDDFFRFPHTAHLLWLGRGTPRGDKLLGAMEAQRFFESKMTLEEKVDGANVGFSVDAAGRLRAQNRGTYVDAASHRQFADLRSWMANHEADLVSSLGSEMILFGEWCVAVHTVEYTRLPDWFLAFDVYHRGLRRFWSTVRRNALCRRLGIATVPILAEGHFGKGQLISLLGASRLGAPLAEGIYLRIDDGDFLAARAKIVAAQFHQSIAEHWSERVLRRNHLK